MGWRAFVVALVVCGGVGGAQAADMSVRPATYGGAYYPGAISWTGFYAGLNLGGAIASASYTDPFDGLGTKPLSGTVMGGGQAGANWQFDALVFGVEADIDGMDIRTNVVDGAGNNHLLRSYWLSTFTARFGYAFNATLLYVKGGAAAGDERNTITTAAAAAFNTSTSTEFGWTVGAGVEYAFNHSWSARLEYDFIDLANTQRFFGPTGSGAASVSYTINRGLAGINYHF
jgi:outer membrane immunogenic protein